MRTAAIRHRHVCHTLSHICSHITKFSRRWSSHSDLCTVHNTFSHFSRSRVWGHALHCRPCNCHKCITSSIKCFGRNPHICAHGSHYITHCLKCSTHVGATFHCTSKSFHSFSHCTSKCAWICHNSIHKLLRHWRKIIWEHCIRHLVSFYLKVKKNISDLKLHPEFFPSNTILMRVKFLYIVIKN